MGDFKKQICRLCLEITPACESESIEAIKKEIQEVLLIKIDFDTSDDAVACSRCLVQFQDCFDFKSHVTSFIDIDTKVDSMNNENISQICRLCMSFIENKSFNYITDWEDGVLLNDMIRSCLPEIDLSTVDGALICKLCLSEIKKYYIFMKKCQDIQQRIESDCQVGGHGIGDKVILKDMLKLRDCDEPIIKKECSDVGNVDEAVLRCCKSEEMANIKCEEIDIKDELDSGVCTSECNQLEDYDSAAMTSSGNIKSESEGKKYSSSKTSKRRSSDNEIYRCSLCSFVTDTRALLRRHLTSHRGPTKPFGCPECPYETNRKSNLLDHRLKHKDNSEVEMHKCALCLYKSKYKRAVENHWKIQHDESIKTYECKECSFSTKYGKSFVHHHLLHKKAEETTQLQQANIKMYKCKECPFGSKHKNSLLRHQLMHRIPKHKCEMCEYETKYKRSLVSHMRTHKDTKVNKFKCEKCLYFTTCQGHLMRHMMTHSEEHTYSCDECPYTTNISGNLLNHKLVHKEDSERQMYKCNLCDYRAKTTKSIKVHTITSHMRPSEVPKLKCAHCPYETTIKHYLLRHIRRRHGKKNQPAYKCTLCLYVTNFKEDLQRHSVVHEGAMMQCKEFCTKHTAVCGNSHVPTCSCRTARIQVEKEKRRSRRKRT